MKTGFEHDPNGRTPRRATRGSGRVGKNAGSKLRIVEEEEQRKTRRLLLCGQCHNTLELCTCPLDDEL